MCINVKEGATLWHSDLKFLRLQTRSRSKHEPAYQTFPVIRSTGFWPRSVTDEQADVALACKVRHRLTLDEIAKRCGKSPEVTKKLLWELANEGVVVTYTSPDDGRDYYTLPCWVPGIMEMMVGNKEQVEAHPEIARCFDEYTLKNMKLMTPNLPRGMGVMRVIPVQKAIDLNRHAVSSDQLSKYIDNAWKIAVTACSCRRTRRIMGEGCGHLEEDMCIMLNKAARLPC